MAEAHPTTAGAAPSVEDATAVNTVDLDPISLAQALLDFDVANARVIDLTKRLTTLTAEVRRSTTELQKTRLRNRRLQTELDAMKKSTAYRSAVTASRVVRGVRSRIRK